MKLLSLNKLQLGYGNQMEGEWDAYIYDAFLFLWAYDASGDEDRQYNEILFYDSVKIFSQIKFTVWLQIVIQLCFMYTDWIFSF